MNATHTPEPWTVDSADLPIIVNGGDGKVYIATVADEWDNHGPETFAEATANARLIAAAPEMREALDITDTLLTDVLDALRDEDAILWSAIRRRLRERSEKHRALLARIDGSATT